MAPLEENVKAYIPPKMWEDLTDSEKIERMREQIHQNQEHFNRRIGELEQKVCELYEHKHLEGQIVGQIKRYGGGISSGCLTPKRADGKSYF